jgi:hypothetical protein
MAKQASLFLMAGFNTQSVTLTSSDTTTAKTCFTAGANDSVVRGIIATTTDSVTVNVTLWVTRSGTDYLLGTVNLPITAGDTGSAPSVDLLASAIIPGLPQDSVGKPYIPLKNGDTLKVGCLATMSTGKTTYVSVFGEDY